MDFKVLIENYNKGFKWLEKNYPLEFFFIEDYIKTPAKWNAKLFLYKEGLKEIPKCKFCKEETKFINISKGYRKYCSVKCLSNDSLVKEKRKKTCLSKYGSENPMGNIDIANKLKISLFDKYGVDNISKLENTKEKVKKTNLANYGFEYNSQRPEIKKILSNNIIDNKSIYKIQKDNRIEYLKQKIKGYKLSFIDESSSIYTFLCNKCNNNFTIHKNTLNDRIRNTNTICTICNQLNDKSSDTQNQIIEFIKGKYNNEVIKNCRSVINGEIDIYLPDIKLGIEYNGIYWHSEKYRDKYYHLNKTIKCSENNIRLIHIWEDDWISKKDIIKSQITNWIGLTENRIYARNCIVSEIKDTIVYRDFLNKNHIQGYVRSITKLGLYFENELVSIMTFDNFEGRKKMTNGGWNLSRFCNKLNTIVIGGASKLLKYFIKKYKPYRVISYADRDWSSGDLYGKLGFDILNDTLPDYKYIINNKRVHKSRFRKSNLKTEYSEGKYMSSINIEKIWDCGKRKYELLFK